MHNLLIITSTRADSEELQATDFFTALQKLPNNIQVGRLSEVEVILKNGSINCTISGLNSDDFDTIYFRRVGKRFDVMEWQAIRLMYPDKRYVGAVYVTDNRSKLVQMAACQSARIRIPHTVFVSYNDPNRSADLIIKECGLPVVCKPCHGTEGGGVEIHTSRASLLTQIQRLGEQIRTVIFQEFIPNTGDYRVVVFDGKVKAVGRREAQTGEWRNNVSLGGSVHAVPLEEVPGDCIAMAEKVSQQMNMAIAGVDIVQHGKTGELYVMETNQAPGMKTPGVSEAYAAYFTQLLTDENK